MIDIQLLQRSNAALLDRLATEVFDNPIDATSLSAFIEDPRHVMFMAIDSDHVVGMASAVEYFHPDKRPQMWINEVGVTPSYRNKGVGRKLIEALLDNATTRGCNSAWLGTDTINQAAQACFGAVRNAVGPHPCFLYEWKTGE